MKCGRCGFIADDKNKYCPECGCDLQMDQNAARLYGQEVDVLFFFDPESQDKITGIINPTLDQFQKHKSRGVVQKVMIGSAMTGTDDNTSAVLAFIRKSLEFLQEPFEDDRYRHLSLPDLKREYLRLFERVLKVKAQRQEIMKPNQPPPPPKK